MPLIDAYGRYLLPCEAVLDPDTRSVQPIFDSAFRELGLPPAIRSDNGPPFATTGAAGLSTLSVWWTKLGIRHDRITPGKPQQTGRLELGRAEPGTIAPGRGVTPCCHRGFDSRLT